MTKFKNWLNEKLLEVDKKDIDMLCEPLIPYSDVITELINKGIKDGDILKTEVSKTLEKANLSSIPFILEIFGSGDLVSENAKSAHIINPIEIQVWNYVEHNAYIPTLNKIQLGLVKPHVNVLFNFHNLASNEYIRFRNEFSIKRIRSTIRHELTHWIDDSLNNLHISKLVDRVSNMKGSEGMKMFLQGKDIVNLTDREINAIVNQLDQLKKDLGRGIWNQLTWDDLETLIGSAYSKHFSPEIGKEFRKKLKKRMAREKILGKNMR